jgi:hypothetical protein
MQDKYMWQVIYADGTFTAEYDLGRSDGRGFAEIEDKTVKHICLLNLGLAVHTVNIPDGAQPVFFRRRMIALDGSGSEQGRSTVHCIGWKRAESACYLFVLPDGSTLLSDDLQAV